MSLLPPSFLAPAFFGYLEESFGLSVTRPPKEEWESSSPWFQMKILDLPSWDLPS
jgi:hypothetical protein